MHTRRRRCERAGFIIVLLICLPALGRAQEPEPPTVAVSATGVVERAPDQATVRLAVETFAETAEAAARRNAERISDVLEALRELGLAEEQIRTTGYRLRPEYEREPREVPAREPREIGGEPERALVGYRAVNMVEVTIRQIDRVGTVIDAAIAAGANRVADLEFGLSEATEAAAREAALREAVRQARDEAETIAHALERTLGPVLRIGTAGRGPPVRPVRYVAEEAAIAAAAVPTPIEPGTLEVRASVSAVFRLR